MMPAAVSCTEAVTSGSYAKYPEAVSLISQAADHLDITGKTVLVIGSEAPWVETILLMRKPRCHLIREGFMINTGDFRLGVTVEYREAQRYNIHFNDFYITNCLHAVTCLVGSSGPPLS